LFSMESLSSRGRRATTPALSYFNLFFEGVEKGLYSPTDTDGYILLAVAENRLLYESVALPRLNSSKVRSQIGNDAGAYSSMTGRKSLKKAWAEFMTRTVMKKYKVDSTNLIVGAGVGSMISNLAFMLCEPGDGILLPVPAYGALFNDFKVVAEAVVVDVVCESPLYRITEEALQKSIERALHNGTIVRILFIVNPNNPFGFVYSKEELLFLIQWATENNLHIVIDEIYANSVWDKDETFVSALDVIYDKECSSLDLDRIHILWGASKDLSLSGYRMGVLHTFNKALQTSFANVNYFHTVSNDTQDAIAAFISDETFIDSYLLQSRDLLRASYTEVTRLLTESNIPFVSATSGMFLWIDLRSCLPFINQSDHPFESERELTKSLFEKCHVLFTPGEAMHALEPGFYRVCYAWQPLETVIVAFKRLKEFRESLEVPKSCL